MTKRLIWFCIMIAIGAAGGLAYGWLINPVKYTDTAPETLRSDYKADYVLMVAEIYRADQNLPAALDRLALFSDVTPAELVNEGLLAAQQIKGYPEEDLLTIVTLSEAVGPPGSGKTSGGRP